MTIRERWLLLLMLGLALPVQAQQEEEEEDPLTGTVKLGYLATTGNTETSSLNAGFEAVYTVKRWEHEATANAVNASENEQTTAEAYEAGWTSRWSLTEKDLLFGRLNWRKDRFGGFDTQFSQTVGYGRRVLDNDRHRLRLEAGVGARQSEDQVGITTDETILSGGLDYTFSFSETSSLRQTIKLEAGNDNTFTESVTALSARLIGRLAMTLSYTYRNNSDVPVGSTNSDTRTAIALEYAF